MVSSQAGKPLIDRCRVPRHAAQPIPMAQPRSSTKRSFGEIEVEFVPYLKLPLLLDKLRG
jgi:hypothetical protein